MRVFLGIPIAEEAAEEIAAGYAAFKGLKAKFVETQNLHVTLKFIGEVKEQAVKNIIKALEPALAGTMSFTVAVNGVKTFPSSQEAKVIWAGIEKGNGAIKEIFVKCEESLYKAGFKKEEKEFIPHITMARVKVPQDVTKMLKGIRIIAETEAQRVVLYKSELSHKGPVYEELWSMNLEAGDK